MANIAIPPLLRHVALATGGSLLYYGAALTLPVTVGDVFDSIGQVAGLLTFVFSAANLLPMLVLGSTIELGNVSHQPSTWKRLCTQFLKELRTPCLAMRLWTYSVPSAAYGLWTLFNRVWP